MTTALDLITGAARQIGVVFKSEALSADEAADGIELLNDMIESWANSGLMVISRVSESFNISPAASYTIGSGQTLNTVRPISIKSAFIRIASDDYPLEILSDEEYQLILQKSLSTNIPEALNYDNANPAGVIRLYPLLSVSAALHLLSEKPLTGFAALTTTVDLPPGWKRLIRSNLAVEMSGEYGVEVPASVAKTASDSLSSVQLAIAKNRPIKFMPRLRRVPNIYTGY